MQLLFNDLSLGGQFRNGKAFCDALARVMQMRRIAHGKQRDIHCHSGFMAARPVQNMSVPKIINKHLPKDARSDVMRWLSRGPFWDSAESQQHDAKGCFDFNGASVSGHAPAEAALRKHQGGDCGLISMKPSDWNQSPLKINWRKRGEGLPDVSIMLENWWKADALKTALSRMEPSPKLWREVESAAKERFDRLVFANHCFERLYPVPFASSAAENIMLRLKALDKIAKERDNSGRRTNEGHQIYRERFMGSKAWFSDSSDTEKNMFRKELTFSNPDNQPVLCSWHGKINHPHTPLRLHFEWPIRHDGTIFIAYIGPKITKK